MGLLGTGKDRGAKGRSFSIRLYKDTETRLQKRLTKSGKDRTEAIHTYVDWALDVEDALGEILDEVERQAALKQMPLHKFLAQLVTRALNPKEGA
jgi:3-methyladenine DNA glycosylase/8-oxoguanine DNA glycosylase